MSRGSALFCLERVLAGPALGEVFARKLDEVGLRSDRSAQLVARASRVSATGVGDNTASGAAMAAASTPSPDRDRATVSRAAVAAADELVTKVPPHAPIEIEEHRAAGRATVLVTAIPKPLVVPLTERLGFDAVIATSWEVAWQRFTGDSGRLGAETIRIGAPVNLQYDDVARTRHAS